jgi:predicted nucleic acid-binding protein
MAFVLDASVALAAVLPGEIVAPVASEMLVRVPEEEAIVPGLWRLEIGNAVLVRLRRRHIAMPEAGKILERLRALPVTLDSEASAHAFDLTFRLALTHTLSLYDATYLELALRRGLSTASLDQALRSVAAALGVPLSPPET